MDSPKQVKVTGNQGFSEEMISSDAHKRVAINSSTESAGPTFLVTNREKGTVAGVYSGSARNIDGRVARNVAAKRAGSPAVVQEGINGARHSDVTGHVKVSGNTPADGAAVVIDGHV